MKFFPSLLCSFLFAAIATAQNRSAQTVMLDEAGVRNLGIETVPANESTFVTTVSALGEIEHTCDSHTVLSSRIPGRVMEVNIHEGEFVTKGEVIARVESRQPGSPPPMIELIAPGSGLVIRSDVNPGAPVEPDKKLLEIIDLSNVWVVASVAQHQAAVLKEDLTAKIRVQAIENGEYEARFLRLGPEADAAKGTVEAIFEIANPDNKLRPGMRAELSLASSKRDGVLSVPRVSLQGERSNRFVFVKDYEIKNAFVKSPVVTGAVSGDRVEIVSGLFPGDEVVTTGAYSLAFAGKGTASLKEALDAAHGHPHKDDGSDMTAEEVAAARNKGTGGGQGVTQSEPLTWFLGIACGVLLVLLLVSTFVRSKA